MKKTAQAAATTNTVFKYALLRNLCPGVIITPSVLAHVLDVFMSDDGSVTSQQLYKQPDIRVMRMDMDSMDMAFLYNNEKRLQHLNLFLPGQVGNQY